MNDWKPVALALLHSWPSQVASWGREVIAGYCSELEARGITPDAAVVAIRACPAGQKFPPSAPELAGLARHDASVPTGDELLELIYGRGGVLRAMSTVRGPFADMAEWDRAKARAAEARAREMHPLVGRFVAEQGVDRLARLEVNGEWGEAERRKLREAWTRLVAARGDREVAALASGGGGDGLRRLDPLAALGVGGRPQIEAGR